MQRRAAFDVGLDVEDQLLHRRLVVAVADDLERLHQRDAGRQHRGQLAAEDRDVLRRDLAAGLEQGALLADLDGHHALPAQVGAQRQLAGGKTSPLSLLPLLSLPSQGKGMSFLIAVALCAMTWCPRYAALHREIFIAVQSTVTRLISSRLVRPSCTFCRPDAAQVPDALSLGLVRDFDRVAAFHDDAADVLGDRHHLVDADPTLVAVGALAAALRAETRWMPFAMSSR